MGFFLVKLIIRDGEHEYEHFDYFHWHEHPTKSIAFQAVWMGDYPEEYDGIRWLTNERALVDVGVRSITQEQLNTLKQLGIV